MNLSNDYGCCVVLIGALKEVPQLSMDDNGNLMMEIRITTKNRFQPTQTYYNVNVFGDAALRIKQCAFPNIRLWIEGDLRLINQSVLIYAHKVGFFIDSEPNEPQGLSKNAEYHVVHNELHYVLSDQKLIPSVIFH